MTASYLLFYNRVIINSIDIASQGEKKIKYTDIENAYGFKFPAKFHEILETGTDNFKSNMEKYIEDPAAFMMINTDCEFISTE